MPTIGFGMYLGTASQSGPVILQIAP